MIIINFKLVICEDKPVFALFSSQCFCCFFTVCQTSQSIYSNLSLCFFLCHYMDMWIIIFSNSDFSKISTDINNTDFFCFIGQIIQQYQHLITCDNFCYILVKYCYKGQLFIAFYFNLVLSAYKHFRIRIPVKCLIRELNFHLFFTFCFYIKNSFISMCKNILR